MERLKALKAASATLNRIADMATGVRRGHREYMLSQIRQAAIAWIDSEMVHSTCGPKEDSPAPDLKTEIDRLRALNAELVAGCEDAAKQLHIHDTVPYHCESVEGWEAAVEAKRILDALIAKAKAEGS